MSFDEQGRYVDDTLKGQDALAWGWRWLIYAVLGLLSFGLWILLATGLCAIWGALSS